MTNPIDLRQLSGITEAAPPFDFGQFERRRATTQLQRRTMAWSVAGSVGMLGVVGLLALLTQQPEAATQISGPGSAGNVAQQPEAPWQPAVVHIDQFDVTSELEDHIALLDAQISVAQVNAASAEQVRELKATREQLNISLQRVSYAQTLLSF